MVITDPERERALELSSFQKRFCTILTSLVFVHHFGYCDVFDVQVCSVVLVNHVQEDGIHFDFALQIDLCTIQKGIRDRQRSGGASLNSLCRWSFIKLP
jgi:hypothetical protein